MNTECYFLNMFFLLSTLSFSLTLSLSVSPSPSPSLRFLFFIELTYFWTVYSVLHIHFRTRILLHGIRARGLKSSTTERKAYDKDRVELFFLFYDKTWIEEWEAHYWMRSSWGATTHLGRTRCTSTCLAMATGVMSKELMIQHPIWHTKTFRLGSNSESSGSRGSHGGIGSQQEKVASEC